MCLCSLAAQIHMTYMDAIWTGWEPIESHRKVHDSIPSEKWKHTANFVWPANLQRQHFNVYLGFAYLEHRINTRNSVKIVRKKGLLCVRNNKNENENEFHHNMKSHCVVISKTLISYIEFKWSGKHFLLLVMCTRESELWWHCILALNKHSYLALNHS